MFEFTGFGSTLVPRWTAQQISPGDYRCKWQALSDGCSSGVSHEARRVGSPLQNASAACPSFPLTNMYRTHIHTCAGDLPRRSAMPVTVGSAMRLGVSAARLTMPALSGLPRGL